MMMMMMMETREELMPYNILITTSKYHESYVYPASDDMNHVIACVLRIQARMISINMAKL